jgi:hypothetical protein
MLMLGSEKDAEFNGKCFIQLSLFGSEFVSYIDPDPKKELLKRGEEVAKIIEWGILPFEKMHRGTNPFSRPPEKREEIIQEWIKYNLALDRLQSLSSYDHAAYRAFVNKNMRHRIDWIKNRMDELPWSIDDLIPWSVLQ